MTPSTTMISSEPLPPPTPTWKQAFGQVASDGLQVQGVERYRYMALHFIARGTVHVVAGRSYEVVDYVNRYHLAADIFYTKYSDFKGFMYAYEIVEYMDLVRMTYKDHCIGTTNLLSRAFTFEREVGGG